MGPHYGLDGMKALILVAFSMFVGAANAALPESPQPEALARQAEEVSHLALTDVSKAIAEITATKEGIRSSPSLLQRTRRRLIKRFPDVQLRMQGTVDDLIKDLQDYRMKQLNAAAALYGAAATKFRDRACQAQKDMSKSSDAILAGDLSNLGPQEEAHFRQLVIEATKAALADDACAPPPPPDTSEANQL